MERSDLIRLQIIRTLSETEQVGIRVDRMRRRSKEKTEFTFLTCRSRDALLISKYEEGSKAWNTS